MFQQLALVAIIILKATPHNVIAFHHPLPSCHSRNNASLCKTSEFLSRRCVTTATPSSSSANSLFARPTRGQKNRSLHLPKQFVALSTEDKPTSNKTLMRRLYDNSIRRLWLLLLSFFKLLVKPLSILKSIATSKTKKTSDSDASIKIENKAPTPIAIETSVTPDFNAARSSVPSNYEGTHQDQLAAETTSSTLVVERPIIRVEKEKGARETEKLTSEIPYFLEEMDSHNHSDEAVSCMEKSSTSSSTDTLTIPVAEKDSTSHEESELALPKGERWAIAAPGVDLTARWKIIVDNDFKEKYDAYLKGLGQPSIVRSVAVSIVEMTTEEIIQEDQGRELCIKGKNLRGLWERTLIASGSDHDEHHQDGTGHLQVPIVTADKEKVEAEAWWEDNGKTHFSILKGVKKYGGGDFVSKRYLENDGDVLVCESAFIPNGKGKEKVSIIWKFKRT